MSTTFIILIIGLLAGGITFLLMSKGKNKVEKNNKDNGKKDGEGSNIPEGTIVRKNGKEIPRKDVTDFMEFDRIIDGMILQENETKFTMVLQCKGINYDLMSDVEQLAIEEGFIVFLNTLKFPVQLYVQARAIDLKKSMDIYQESVDDLLRKYNQADDNYKALSNEIDVDFTKVANAKEERDRYANILEYAQDITRYVERISLNKNILQRKFYIVFSYYKSEVTSVSEFSNDEIYEICHRELYTRAQSIISALTSCSVTSKILNSNELAELLFISYNRDDEKLINISTSLESGFYRLYSTSQDVYEKKEELIQQEIQEEATKRVQEAIRQTLRSAIVKSDDEIEEEFEENTDRQALEIIRNADIDDASKQNLTKIIAENHVRGVEERKRARRMKNTLIENENKTEENNNEEKEEEIVDEKKEEENNDISTQTDRNYVDVEVDSNTNDENESTNPGTVDSSEDDIIV